MIALIYLAQFVIFSRNVWSWTPDMSPCHNMSLSYNDFGVISFVKTFQDCLDKFSDDIRLFPGYFFPSLLPFQVESQISINNLISIDDVAGSCDLDFFFRLYWTDPRLNMTSLFDHFQSFASTGISITDIYEGDSSKYNFW